MELLIDGISVLYPTKAERARSQGVHRKKPQARIVCSAEGGQERTLFVPARVARAVQRDLPVLPIAYDQLREMVFRAEDRSCYTALVEMLGRRDYADAEARRRLSLAGYRDESVAQAIERARASRFMDDDRFARQFIEQRKLRGWGRRKIEMELKARGIDPDGIAGYPDAFFSEDDDLERACALLEKKSVPESRAFEKLVRHLMGKGFSYSTASSAVRARLDSVDDF